MVFHEGINHMPMGRNVGYLRLVDAFTHVQEKGEVCPANWEEGKDAMNANRDGANYLVPINHMLQELTEDNLADLIRDQPLAFVQYSAGWCGNCRIMETQVQKIFQ